MKIFTLWKSDGDVPWLVAACDELTVEENDGYPDYYAEARKDLTLREMIIDFPTGALTRLFVPPTVRGTVHKTPGAV